MRLIATVRRVLAQGLARNQGRFLGQAAEEQEAGERSYAAASAGS